jgi:hypothetical protein
MLESDSDMSAPLGLHVSVNPLAPAAVQAFAEHYWDLLPDLADNGDPQWRFKTSDLNYSLWSGTAYYVAAAGATATANGLACGTCGGPLTLTSRQALLDTFHGRSVPCRECNVQVDSQAQKILSEEGVERQAAKLRTKEKASAAQAARQQLEIDRHAYISNKYVVKDTSEEYLLDQASLLARIGVLSVVSGTGDQGGLLVGVDLLDGSTAPSSEFSRSLFVASWSAQLLQIHPTTPVTSLEWVDNSAEDTGAIFTDKVRFFAAGYGTLPERLSTLVAASRERVSVEGMWSTERTQLRVLAIRVIAEEAARYLTAEVAAHRLPQLTEVNREALKLVVDHGASLFSLGHLYGFAWRAARDASSAYQRNRGMPSEKAITHGLRKFETYIQAAVDDPASMKSPFSESTAIPLSAVTRLVFNDILGLDPMQASPQDIDIALASPPDDELRARCDAATPARSELMEWMRSDREGWNPRQFRTVLARLEDWLPELCAPHCGHERVGVVAVEAGRSFDRVVSLTDESTAAIMTAEAIGIANAISDGVRTGDVLLAELISRLRLEASAHSSPTYL